ncbi:MAG: NAD-dependent epimerase/dehydratase family protein [Deltaproteobacteria bacterium]|nr:NAD-dependent epimerase/dehydratase family protein [Deltaproteobacteria bacterium]
MKIVVFGATGMIGAAVLLEAFDDPQVTSVLAVGRRPTGREHAKLRELVHADFLDFSAVQSEFADVDACLWCLGVPSSGMSEADYRRFTVEITVAASKALLAANPAMRMCFVSGAGSNREGRAMWQRVKAEAEDAVLAMPWRSVHCFRPGAILPERGVQSRVALYRAMYAGLGWAIRGLRTVAPNAASTSPQLAQAMLAVARHGEAPAVLEVADIHAVVIGGGIAQPLA